jgi:hypothetical protein
VGILTFRVEYICLEMKNVIGPDKNRRTGVMRSSKGTKTMYLKRSSGGRL